MCQRVKQFEKVQSKRNKSCELPCDNPLSFWKLKENEYPILAQIAKKLFSVPATSAPVERVFSQAGKFFDSTKEQAFTTSF